MGALLHILFIDTELFPNTSINSVKGIVKDNLNISYLDYHSDLIAVHCLQ